MAYRISRIFVWWCRTIQMRVLFRKQPRTRSWILFLTSVPIGQNYVAIVVIFIII